MGAMPSAFQWRQRSPSISRCRPARADPRRRASCTRSASRSSRRSSRCTTSTCSTSSRRRLRHIRSCRRSDSSPRRSRRRRGALEEECRKLHRVLHRRSAAVDAAHDVWMPSSARAETSGPLLVSAPRNVVPFMRMKTRNARSPASRSTIVPAIAATRSAAGSKCTRGKASSSCRGQPPPDRRRRGLAQPDQRLQRSPPRRDGPPSGPPPVRRRSEHHDAGGGSVATSWNRADRPRRRRTRPSPSASMRSPADGRRRGDKMNVVGEA